MKVLEIKNNLVKIAHDVTDNLALGGFVIIEDKNNPYVAQVMNLKSENVTNYAIVKLLFTFDDEGILKNYNGTIPSLSANVSLLPSRELLDIIPAEDPLILGSIAQQDINLTVDKTILDNNLLICSNNLANTTTLLSNITEQIKEKAIIIDTEGQFEWDRTVKFGKDFKLPLNYETINYIYDNDLEDVDAISKAVIQDIFIEVQEYIKTLPERFLPFDTFISVIDSQYRETQIPQLILLKNKLLKYKELNVFAQNLKDILELSITIENAKNVSIDISDIPENFQKEIITYIYKVLNGINEQIYCFVKVNNSNITKKLLKRYITRDNVFTTVICPHEFKYIEEIKEASQNIIFFAPLTLQHDFASYNSFLNKLNNDEFIIYGAHTQDIPFITELTVAEEIQQKDVVPMPQSTASAFENYSDTEQEIDNINNTNEIEEVDKIEEVNEPAQITQYPEINYPDIEDDVISDSVLEDEIIEEPVIEDRIIDESVIEDAPLIDEPGLEEAYEVEAEENYGNEIYNDTQPVANILEDDNVIYEPLDEQVDLANEYIPADDEEITQELSNDELVEQVAKDVDKVLYEKLPNDGTFEDYEEPIEEEMSQTDLTEDDLNLIDDLSINDEISLAGDEEHQEYESFTDEELPPVVPIYPAEDMEDNEIPTFEPGDRVTTAKYGEGVVEKMIKYGNKMLCSIDFATIGRRLLDPAMTEITKLS